MLNLYKLDIFNTVAMEGSFSKAAERLLLSQPAVSQHIRDLEASLSIDLFDRGPRGAKLTSAGETLLDYTRCILRLVSEAEVAVSSLNDVIEGQLSIGATPGASVYLLPQWIQAFHQRFPSLAVLLRTDTTGAIAEDLRSGQLDLGIVEGEIRVASPLRAMDLREIELWVVVGSGHPWDNSVRVNLHQLNGEPFITRPAGSQTRAWIDQLLAHHAIKPNIVAEFDNPEAIKRAVASGLGVTILPDWGMETLESSGRLKLLPIEGLDLRRTLKLLWRSDVAMKASSRAFITQLTDQFPQLAQVATFAGLATIDLPLRNAYRASANCSQD